MDKNGDMKLSFDEAMNNFWGYQNMTRKRKQRLFSRKDRNSDGFISPDEFDVDLNVNELKASDKYL